ncbi:hypothetical protein [Pseudomonas putida]|uniref:Uncharacterized protein n=1 Tax=Pseudomonas putida TaxID=303 RepID=A0A6I6XML8_PSEPU|nr:hypothetical protein [Pseudomonas putida]QHG66993.2 hypothetical protein C2H86_22310 [Pseudomonas putida]
MEFTDVKSKDFIELAGIPEHLQGTAIAEQRVKWRLREALEANDILEPIERLHYTTWDSHSGAVNYSRPWSSCWSMRCLTAKPPPSVQPGVSSGLVA